MKYSDAAEVLFYTKNIKNENIRKRVASFIKMISILSQDEKNHNQILDWIDDINMNRYITNENVKYIRSFYMFLARMPLTSMKDKVQELIDALSSNG